MPWRILIPGTAEFDAVAGANGTNLQSIASDTGVRLDVANAPALVGALGGPVVTVHGSMWQKRTAGRRIVDALFELQGCDARPAIEQPIPVGDPRQRWWQFSGRLAIMLPGSTHTVVTSPSLRKSVEDIGVQMSVGTPLHIGQVSRFLVNFQGNAQQVVSAISRVSVALQDLVDSFKLRAHDFIEEGVGSDAGFGGGASAPPPAVADLVRAARLAPAAGVATQPPHEHPAMVPSGLRRGREVGEPEVLAPLAAFGPRHVEPQSSGNRQATPPAAPGLSPPAPSTSSSAPPHAVESTDPSPSFATGASLLSVAPVIPVVSNGAANASNVGSSQPLTPSAEKAWAAASAAASSSETSGGAPSQLLILLPCRVVLDFLIPSGHLAAIGRCCGVRIDVLPGSTCSAGEEQKILTFSGPVAANALASLHLQWRAAQCA